MMMMIFKIAIYKVSLYVKLSGLTHPSHFVQLLVKSICLSDASIHLNGRVCL